MALRLTSSADLDHVASWVGSPADCRVWAGSRISYPIDLEALPGALEFATAQSWCLVEGDDLLGFGQLVPKPVGRLHLARLIVSPAERGRGWGRRLTEELLGHAEERRPSVISLNVVETNDVAISLYESLGFEIARRPVDEPDSSSRYMERTPGPGRDAAPLG